MCHIAALLACGLFGPAPVAADNPGSAARTEGQRQKEEKHVVFVTGDDEYASEISMPMIASVLQRQPGFKTTVLRAVDADGRPDPHGQSIPGLRALRDADLAVFFLRFRALPEPEISEIERYLASGRPVIGLRTSSHAFKYKQGPYRRLNDGFGDDVLGQRWIAHYGHNTQSTASAAATAASHPILRGVPKRFDLSSWLYVTSTQDRPLPSGCTVLLNGHPVGAKQAKTDRFGQTQPLAWTRLLKKEGAEQRVFYTTLGHPRDFSHAPSRRLLLNAIYWALGAESQIPPDGVNAPLPEGYDPPDPK